MGTSDELLARLDKRVANTGTEHPEAAARIRTQAARIAELEKERNLWRIAYLEKRCDGEYSLPKIVCLCGSSKFWQYYQEEEYRETMAGNIYLSIGFYPHAAAEMHGEGVGHTPEQKIALDELHKRKIDLADEVFVLNVGGYIGESTRSEIEYAERTGKPVRYLEALRTAEKEEG